jgi:hypothetical protein
MKRFTENQKWDDPWFMELPMEYKVLWLWLCDKCDNAGIIDPSLRLASFHIGFQYPMDSLLVFGDRIIEIGKGKWFIPKFITFQYGTLSRDCKAHNPIFTSLEKHGIDAINLRFKGYAKGIHTLQEKEKEKDKEKETFFIPENATEKDALIKGSANKNKKARFNTPLMIRVGSWFGRREDTIWTNQETQSLIDAAPTPAQIDGMERFYMAEETNPPTLHHKHSLITMLNQWNTELDKARKYATDQAKRTQ